MFANWYAELNLFSLATFLPVRVVKKPFLFTRLQLCSQLQLRKMGEELAGIGCSVGWKLLSGERVLVSHPQISCTKIQHFTRLINVRITMRLKFTFQFFLSSRVCGPSAAGVLTNRCRRSPCIGSSAACVRTYRCRRNPCIGSSAACVRKDRCRRSPCIGSSASCVRKDRCRSPFIGSSAACVRTNRCRRSPCTGSSAACVRKDRCRHCSPCIGSSADCVRKDVSRQSLYRGPQMGHVAQQEAWKDLTLLLRLVAAHPRSVSSCPLTLPNGSTLLILLSTAHPRLVSDGPSWQALPGQIVQSPRIRHGCHSPGIAVRPERTCLWHPTLQIPDAANSLCTYAILF